MPHTVEGGDVRIFEQPQAYQHELLVLDCFNDQLDNGDQSIGIVFTSRRLFRTMKRAILGSSQ
jgi:hypothetical protein